MAEVKSVKTTPPRGERKCKMEGCKRPYKAKGYCNVHYKTWRQHDLPKGRYKICTKEGCKKPRAAQGSLCAEHLAGGEQAAAG